jgi:hypothetical protein
MVSSSNLKDIIWDPVVIFEFSDCRLGLKESYITIFLNSQNNRNNRTSLDCVLWNHEGRIGIVPLINVMQAWNPTQSTGVFRYNAVNVLNKMFIEAFHVNPQASFNVVGFLDSDNSKADGNALAASFAQKVIINQLVDLISERYRETNFVQQILINELVNTINEAATEILG